MSMKNVFIAAAARTAVGRAPRGTLRETRPDDMAAVVLKEAVARTGIEPATVQDGGHSRAQQPAGDGDARCERELLHRFHKAPLERKASVGKATRRGDIPSVLAGRPGGQGRQSGTRPNGVSKLRCPRRRLGVEDRRVPVAARFAAGMHPGRQAATLRGQP